MEYFNISLHFSSFRSFAVTGTDGPAVLINIRYFLVSISRPSFDLDFTRIDIIKI